jgi:hypothetical protein
LANNTLVDLAQPETSTRYSTVDHARHGDALKLVGFWESRPADGLVMARDIPSRSISHLLKNVAILEPTPDRTDMHIRLAGASLIRRWGTHVKGRMLSQLLPPSTFQDHLRSHLTAIDTDKPVIVDVSLMAYTVEKLQFEVVLLPIYAPDHKCKWVLSGMFFFY